MFVKNLLKSGWIHALCIGVIFYPLASVSQKIVADFPNGNIMAYTFFMMLASAGALLLFAGPGTLIVRTLRRPETWLYSLLQILVIVFSLAIMKYVSATESVGLFRITGFFTLILTAIFLHQKISKFEVIGSFFILIGFCLIINNSLISNSDLAVESKTMLVILILARSLSKSSQKIITEIHKTNRKANNFKDQLRVTAFIMAVGTLVFGIVLSIIACVKEHTEITFLEPFPKFTDFLHFDVYIMAFVLGFFITSLSKYCEFYAGKTIGSKYLTTITSLQIVFVFIIEKLLGYSSIMEKTNLQSFTFVALAFILLGNFVISFAGFLSNLKFIKKGKKQDTLANMDENFVDSQRDFDLVKLNLINLLSLYDGNSKKLSEEIQIDRVSLDNIVNYDLEDFKLEKKIAKTINEFASHNVALKDKLTKAYNRYYLANIVKELLEGNIEFRLYMLDLNKFKHVNDTFGHHAGDATLVETVKRLSSLVGKDSVFRVGGDEFVLIQYNDLETDLRDLILKIVEEPINYEKHTLEISTSIGLVQSSKYDDLDAMLAVADENMYEDKESRKR
ncbi:MAG: diguanylate cyclase [Proteobacteria bacterium]|nr:diguanylate cyclase [Pseudomonadota bacterium]